MIEKIKFIDKKNCQKDYGFLKKISFNILKVDMDKLDIKKIENNAKRYLLEYLKISVLEMSDSDLALFLFDNEKKYIKNNRMIIKIMLELNWIDNYLLLDNEWVLENLKEVMMEFCYKICESFNWIYDEIKKYCDSKYIDNIIFMEFAVEYALAYKYQGKKKCETNDRRVNLNKEKNPVKVKSKNEKRDFAC